MTTNASAADELVHLRGELALVRTLLDEVERVLAHPSGHAPPSEQLADELARLGHFLVEKAAIMNASIAPPALARADTENAS